MTDEVAGGRDTTADLLIERIIDYDHEMTLGDVDDLDAPATLAALEDNVRSRRSAAVDELLLVLHWCDLHDDIDEAEKRDRTPGGDRLVVLGGEGTPEVAELCFAESAIARHAGVIATRNLAADALDLRHRLPRLFTQLRALDVDTWVAREVAAMARRLSKQACEVVDEPAPAAARDHRRPAEIVIHLHHDAVAGASGDAVARVEDLGPMLADQLTELLGIARRHVAIRPVIDLNQVHDVNGYEHLTRIRHRTRLRTGGDVVPHTASAVSTRSRLDHDHPTPYDDTGPPGQTGDLNDAPLTRHHHRAKTHHRYQVDQLALGVYRWRSPHGLVRIVSPSGTRPVTPITTHDGTTIGETYGGPALSWSGD